MIQEKASRKAFVSDCTEPLNIIFVIDYDKEKYRPDINMWFVNQSSNFGSSRSFCYGITINPALINYTVNNTFYLQRDNYNISEDKTNKHLSEDRTEKQRVDFYSFALDYIESFKNKYAESTYKMMVSEINKLKRFSPLLTFDEIDYDFIYRYEIYLRNILKNQPNTVAKSLKKIQLFINVAIRKGILASNPVSYYKVKTIPSQRAFLNVEELQILEHLYNNKEIKQNMRETMRCFLFACYTGLRYSDIRMLDYKSITDNCIQLVQCKTGTQVSIPLSNKAKRLIDQSQHSGRVFTVYSNMKTNEHIKWIIDKAIINKKTTFHSARHTFATISLNIGIPIEVVSKLLGHVDIKTTLIYAKLFEKTKFEHMEKWNKLETD